MNISLDPEEFQTSSSSLQTLLPQSFRSTATNDGGTQPTSRTTQHHGVDHSIDSLDSDPDAYYRPYSTQSTNLPDIFIHNEHQAMPPKRKPVAAASTVGVNGTGGRSSSTTASNTSRTASRSASNPAMSTNAPPQSTVPGRTSIKERVKQLEQANSSDKKAVPTASTARSASRIHKTPSKDKSQNENSPMTNRKRVKNTSGRPLFGEITGAAGVGFGIPSLVKQRSNVETSMPPISSASRPLDTAHQRTSSDETEIEVDGSSAAATPPENMTPSRIPVPRPRRASDLDLTHHARSTTPTRTASPRLTRTPGAKTPGSSSRRYSPKRHQDNNTSLTAIIKEPLPKLSPPLRSSRPRQPVSAASTAASRAKVSERFTNTISQQPKARSAPKDFPRVDVASRRDAVQTHLARTYVDTKAGAGASAKSPAAPKSAGSPQFPGAFPDSPSDYFEHDVNVALSEDSFGATANDGSTDQAFSRHSDETTDYNGGELTEDVYSSIQERNTLDMKDHANSEEQRLKKSTLAKNVWILRQDSPTTSEPRLPEDMLSEIGDGETINIVLGDTPVLPQANFQPPEPSPVPEIDEDSLQFNDGRSSIYPDDSISVVFQQRASTGHDLSQVPPVPALPKLQTGDIPPIDSATRSQINHVLADYQHHKNSKEVPQPYEDYISQLTPSMAAHAQFGNSGSTSPLNRTPSYNTLLDADGVKALDKQMLDDEEEGPSGTAIIFTKSDNDQSTSHSSQFTIKPHQTSVESRPTSKHSTGAYHSRKSSRTSQRQSEDFGYAYVTSGTSIPIPQSPAPPSHAPPPPPFESGSKSSRREHEALPRKDSWAATNSPIPRGRSRKDTYDTDGSSTHRVSRTSRPETLSSTTRKSIDTSSSDKSGNMSKAEKDLKQRWHIIKELVDTEHKFVYDMIILVTIFMETSNSVPSLAADDRRCIFGNAEKVSEVSSKFLDALKKSSSSVYQIPSELRYQANRGSADTNRTGDSGKAISAAGLMPDRDIHAALDRKTTIGATFLAYADELDKVYRSYMINHSSMNKRRLAIMSDKRVKMWLDECVAAAKDMSGIWSLDSMTIKPTQRYLKYHLLLKQILDHTPLDHPDYVDIAKALEIFTAASQSINDNARKREITGTLLTESKIKPKKISFRDMIMARSKGAKQRSASTSTPVTSTDPQYDPNDNSYEAIRQRFGGHFFQLQIVMRDFEKYLDDKELHLKQIYTYAVNLKANYRCDLGYNRFPQWESRIHQFVELIESIQRHAWPSHQESVRKFVITPVRKLWRMHDTPQHLMFKHRKLKVSMQKYSAARDKGDTKTQDRYRDEAKNWEVLNDVLTNELPQLYSLTKQTVHACLKNFLDIEARWNVMWLNKLKHFCGDYDADMFFENEIDVFYRAVMDEFRHDTEEVDFQLANMMLAQPQGEGLEGISIGVPEPDGGHEPVSPAESRKHRPSQSSSRRPTNLQLPYGANGSSEQVRSTPNLNLGAVNSSLNSANRLSDHQDAPTNHRTNLLGRHDGARSGGPTTPTYNGPLSAGHQRHIHTPQDSEPFVWRPIESPSTYPDSSAYASFTTEERMQQYREVDAIQRHHDSQRGNREAPRFTSALPGEWPVQTPVRDQEPRSARSNTFGQSVLQVHSRNPSHSQPGEQSGVEEVPRFVAASLFEFRIDSSLLEKGYPYLQYVAGDVFDVVGQDGELWLARNQDDPSVLGWVWNRHCAILPMS